MSDIKWTAQESLACALCWAGFSAPDECMKDQTPQEYWLLLPDRTRNTYRHEAKVRMLLAIARGQAVAVTPASSWTKYYLDIVGRKAGLKVSHRIWKIVNIVYYTAYGIRDSNLPMQEDVDNGK